MTWLKSFIARLERVVLDLISKWWRPLFYVNYVVSFAVNLIIIPLWTKTPPDLTAASAYLAGGAALTGLRTVEKIKQVARGQ